ncbi:MAG: hypothetical protein ABMB14_40785, partial [Myxococcota bacterium]
VVPAPDDDVDAGPELARVAAAHGSDRAFRDRIAAGPVDFRYDRTLPDGRVIHHRWASRGADVYVEVSGEGIPSSRTRIVGGKAELAVGDGGWVAQDLDRTREIVEALGPLEVLPLVLAVGPTVASRREFAEMEVAGAGEPSGGPTVTLSFGGDATTGPIELDVGRDDHLIRRVRFDEDAVVREYAEYRSVGSAKVPFAVTVVRRDGRTESRDQIRIQAFELGGTLPAAWFSTR